MSDATASTATPTTFPDADGQWRRLSTRMLLVHPVQELIRFLPVLIGLVIGGTANGGGGHYWSLIGVGLAVALGVSRWFTTTYRVTTQQVQLRKGLLRKRSFVARLDRVRTVDVTANALHRMLGLARLSIGTGMSDRRKDGLLLDALTAQEATRLRDELLHHRGPLAGAGSGWAGPAPLGAGPVGAVPVGAVPAGGPADLAVGVPPGSYEPAGAAPFSTSRPAETTITRWSPSWLRYGPFSLSGLVTIGAIAAVLSRVVNEAQVNPDRFGPTRSAGHYVAHTAPAVVALEGVVVVLIVVAIASTAGYLLAFFNFSLVRYAEGTLHVTRGLLTTRATTIEEARLRGVELSQPLLLRAVGGARCLAIATGLRVGRGSERGGTLLLPPAPGAEARRVTGQILRTDDPVFVALRSHGPAAIRRRWSRALSLAAVLVIALWAVCAAAHLPAGYWVAAALPLLIAASLAADRARALGHALAGAFLVSQRGSLVRRRVMLHRDGVLGYRLRASFFQRRQGLSTLTAATAAGRQGYPVQDVTTRSAVALAMQLTPGLLEPFLDR